MAPSDELVAVVGAGPAGLSALKHLREEGFQVTLFERRSDVGGIWDFSANPGYTSAVACTRSQITKYISPMTDFPFPEEYPSHISGRQWGDYYKAYARHFNLYENVVFGATVSSIKLNDGGGRKWRLVLEGEPSPREFDRIVWASGTETLARWPRIDGIDQFRGLYIHGQAYKGPDSFKGKKVIVLGLGNSAGDIAVDLVPHASSVLLSHRRGAKMVPRLSAEGIPGDSVQSWVFSRFVYFLQHYVPGRFESVVNGFFDKLVADKWGVQQPEWGFEPSPRIGSGVTGICINDDIIPILRGERVRAAPWTVGMPSAATSGDDDASDAGKTAKPPTTTTKKPRLESVPGVWRIIGPHEVELTDGRVVMDVDVIVAATGYAPDFGPLVPDAVGMTSMPTGWADGSATPAAPAVASPAGDGYENNDADDSRPSAPAAAQLPDLYQNIFSLRHPDSVACLNWSTLGENAATFRELSAMAVAQVWAGKSALPPAASMAADVAAYQRWLSGRMAAGGSGGNYAGLIRGHAWMRFVHGAAGLGVYENLGGWGCGVCTWRAWRLWWSDPVLFRLAAYGVYSPHIYVLFDVGKRKPWAGARDAIVKINEERERTFPKKRGRKPPRTEVESKV